MERYARLGASDVRAAAMPFSAYDDKRSRGRALITSDGRYTTSLPFFDLYILAI